MIAMRTESYFLQAIMVMHKRRMALNSALSDDCLHIFIKIKSFNNIEKSTFSVYICVYMCVRACMHKQ